MWNAVITNAGADLLTRWAGGGLLTIDGVSAGTGSVDVAALIACTALAGEEHTDAQLVGSKAVKEGMRYDIQFTAVETAYVAHQIGIWAHVGDESGKTLLAIFQSDEGIAVQSIADMPNFIFSFKATLAIDNTGEMITVTDSGAFICWADFNDAMANFSITIDDTVTESGANAVTGAAVWKFAGGGIPVPTPEDAGKFLRVDAEGAYALEAVPNAEEASF